MKCPKCGGQHLQIEMHFQGLISALFHDETEYELTEPVSLTSSWENHSPCHCRQCDWTGCVQEALTGTQQTNSTENPISVQEPEEVLSTSLDVRMVQELLKSEPCPSTWAQCITFLLEELEQARIQVAEWERRKNLPPKAAEM